MSEKFTGHGIVGTMAGPGRQAPDQLLAEKIGEKIGAENIGPENIAPQKSPK